MRVSVLGLGYVGCVSAACLAKEGFDVIGVDVNPAKVDLIDAGKATVLEDGIADLVRDGVRSGRLRATTDTARAVLDTDVSLMCVGTPSRSNGDIDLSFVERACEQVGRALASKNDPHSVVVRSTVLPGSIDRIVIPALEAASGKSAGRDFSVCSNPEFLREGSSVRDFYDPPFTLIGAPDEEAAEPVRRLYAGVPGNVIVTDVRVAEIVKYVCNCFHGLKVGFANEIGNVCKTMGIDSHEVMRIVCEDRKLNISPAYLRPGFAFGGSCLPKDLRALTYRASRLDVPTPILGSLLEANRKQVERGVGMVLASGARKVGVLGMAFKAGTDDLREAPVVALVEQLIGKGLDLAVYDRLVSESGLIGSNRAFIEEEIPHIWSIMRPSLDEVLEHGDVLVIGNASEEFIGLQERLRNDQIVVDLVRAFGDRVSEDHYHGICW